MMICRFVVDGGARQGISLQICASFAGEEFSMTKSHEVRHISVQIIRPPERKTGNGNQESME
jgi:hypothetical protein